MSGEFKIKNFDEFTNRINTKFREAASYELTNRISDINDVNYGKRKQTKTPLTLSSNTIVDMCQRLITNVINFYLPKQDLISTVEFDEGIDESFDEVGQILQTKESDLLIDTSNPVINTKKTKTFVESNKELELKKIIAKEKPFPTSGTLLSEFCQGFDLFGKYADGKGGEYTALIAANSTQCGYSTPDGQSGSNGGGGGGGGGRRRQGFVVGESSLSQARQRVCDVSQVGEQWDRLIKEVGHGALAHGGVPAVLDGVVCPSRQPLQIQGMAITREVRLCDANAGSE